MKKVTMNRFMAAFIAIVFSAGTAWAQAPDSIPYQAVARDNNGNVLKNTTVGLEFIIRDKSATGTPVYEETQTATTNELGLISVMVGNGNVPGINPVYMNSVNWQQGSKFLDVLIDINGGSNYKELGTQQLCSVPYALSSGDGVPVGTVVAFAGINPPKGWLICNGATLYRFSTYNNLFQVIGAIYGGVDLVDSFKIPDYRGMFLRGIDNGAGNDPDVTSRTAQPNSSSGTGNNVGTIQQDAFQYHTHSLPPTFSTNGYQSANGGDDNYRMVYPNSTTSGQAGTSTETRPKNVYVNYIIKY